MCAFQQWGNLLWRGDIRHNEFSTCQIVVKRLATDCNGAFAVREQRRCEAMLHKPIGTQY